MGIDMYDVKATIADLETNKASNTSRYFSGIIGINPENIEDSLPTADLQKYLYPLVLEVGQGAPNFNIEVKTLIYPIGNGPDRDEPTDTEISQVFVSHDRIGSQSVNVMYEYVNEDLGDIDIGHYMVCGCHNFNKLTDAIASTIESNIALMFDWI